MRPAPDAVREQLDRVLADPLFANSRRLSRFLRYVVERALAGEGDRLKEYVVGLEVFDRDAQYDPRVDSIVRVEAGRLRAKLAEYYRLAGTADAIVIGIERGSYAPVFASRTNGAAHDEAAAAGVPAAVAPRAASSSRSMRAIAIPSALATSAIAALAAWYLARTPPAPPSSAPVIAVAPFEPYGNEPAARTLALELGDGVTGELVRIGTLTVAASASTRRLENRAPREIAAALGADLVLQGRITLADESVTADIALVDAAADRKVWFDSFQAQLTELNELERRVAAATVAAIGKAARPR